MNHARLDCRGQRCPIPLVNLAGKLKDMEPGDEVDFTADDASCVSDLPAWCSITGHELVSLDTTDGIVHAVVRRVG